MKNYKIYLVIPRPTIKKPAYSTSPLRKKKITEKKKNPVYLKDGNFKLSCKIAEAEEDRFWEGT